MPRIIDSHCHIYPAGIAAKAIAAVDRFYDGLPDCHHDGTPDTLLAEGRAAGISHFIVHSVSTTPEQVASINRFIVDAVANAGGAFTGLGTVHPDSEDPEATLQSILDLGLAGVKLHPDIQRFDADGDWCFRICDWCQTHGVPVLMHTGDLRHDHSNPDRIANLLRAFPRLQLVGAHFGGWSVWEEAMRLLPDFENLRVDTSSSFFWLNEEQAMELIRAYGPERILFGTDYPLWGPTDDLAFFDRLPLDEEEREKILWRNCRDLYRISEKTKPIFDGLSG